MQNPTPIDDGLASYKQQIVTNGKIHFNFKYISSDMYYEANQIFKRPKFISDLKRSCKCSDRKQFQKQINPQLQDREI